MKFPELEQLVGQIYALSKYQQGCRFLQKKLEDILKRKLAEAHDEFLSAEDYIRKWGYTVDANGTVPYEP